MSCILQRPVNPTTNPNLVYSYSKRVSILIILFTYILVYKQCWINTIIFWNVTSCGQVQVHPRFRETYHFHIQHRWIIRARQVTNNGQASERARRQFRVSFISGIGPYAASVTVFESLYLEIEVCTCITCAMVQSALFDRMLYTMQDRWTGIFVHIVVTLVSHM
jgi:hypothetical protein